nr:PREDICTED: dynein heavy chain 7, axonemal-like [Bemisia tabaci]
MTAETVRCNALMQLLLIHEKPLLWVGPTGTGKSVYTINFLLKKIDLEKYRPVFLNFSPQTTAKQVQDLIMSRLDKRRKGVYGPALGKKCILFIDDVNMPNEEAYGAKPPVELMRQLIDHNMWFEQKDMIPVKILDVQLIAAVNPTNPETSITPRFSRHFNIVAINEFSDQVMVAIYSKIMLWHLDTRGFSKEFDPCIEQIVSATLAFYKACLLNLRPTPSKVHYMFNLRDFAKVIQGVLLSVPEAVEDLSAMKRLWVHEVMRVYYDRLVSEEDCIWLVRTLHLVCHENLKQDLNEMCSHLAESEPINITEYELRNLIYCDFTNPKADMRHYLEVEDIDTLQGIIEGYLTEYNNMSKKPLNLVMFKYAVEHLTRIARILKQPRSHGLLIGVNGSGKQSLTRLAAHITEYEFFQPEITRTYSKNEWCQDLKTIIRKASASDAHVVLLMEEAQILEESMVEDVCNVLTFGEVPNLFALDEKMDLCERIRSLDRKRDKVLQSDGSTVALYNFFLQTVREQLHIMIALNPTDKRFRQRLRKYPALVNCCAINWFHIWANDSLSAIGQKLISSADLIKEERDICVEACKHFHSSTLDLAHEAQILYNQIIHVTSVSFVELVILFKDLVNKKKSDLRKSMKNYEIGLEKLENAASQISIMQEELLKLEPALDVANLEVIEVTATVEKETMEFEKTATFIKEDEALTNTLSATVESIKSECDDCMNEVTPIMNTAVAMLNGLNPADLTVLKTIKNPTKAVRMIMEAVCILKDIKPDRIPDPGGSGKMVEDFWAPFKRLLGDAKFVEGLVNYDKSSITAKTGKTLKEKFLSHEEFDVDKVKSVSIAAEGLCRWVVAVIKYNDVSTIVAPKQQELAEAEAKLNHAIGVLKEKQSKVEAAENELKELVKKLETKKLALHNLQANLDSCRTKLQRAEDLISGLGGEKSKWSYMAESLAKKCLSLTGDVMLAAGVIGYLGAFCPNLRRQQSIAWENYLKINRLSCSESFHISEVLGNDVEMLNWKIHGLPNDAVFVENGIILK